MQIQPQCDGLIGQLTTSLSVLIPIIMTQLLIYMQQSKTTEKNKGEAIQARENLRQEVVKINSNTQLRTTGEQERLEMEER